MEKLPQFLKAVVFQNKWTVIEPNYGPSFIDAHVVKCIVPLKSPTLTFWTKKDYKLVKDS